MRELEERVGHTLLTTVRDSRQPFRLFNAFRHGYGVLAAKRRFRGGSGSWGDSGESKVRRTASDAVEFDRFGWSVALSGDIAVVGAGGNRQAAKRVETHELATDVVAADGRA